jgi:hypothetical protein
MERRTRWADAFEDSPPGDVARVAETVRDDFDALCAILDRHMKVAPGADNRTRSQIADAKLAAQRGVELSKQLLEKLRAAG